MTSIAHIIPVYQRLASDAVLARCSQGETQSANESLHSVIWSKCPKEVFVSKKKIFVAVVGAVSQFNQGCYKTEMSRTPKGTPLSDTKVKISKLRVRCYIRQNVKRSLILEKYRRHSSKLTKLHMEEALKEKEGKTYGAGDF